MKGLPTALLALALVAAACSGGNPTVTATSPSSPVTSPTITTTAPPPPSGAVPLVASLPDGCPQAVPAATATVTFVAGERAWAVAPDGTGLTCLFEVTDPGLFTWGPQADRIVLSGLEVRGVGSDASRPSVAVEPADASWGRPIGLALAYVDTTGTKLGKALVGGDGIQDVTPFDNVTYQQVIYHPSGLALAFTLTDSDGSSIWMSSNNGKDPTRLVWSREGTIFGPISFSPDGTTLYYGALLSDGTHMVSKIDLGHSQVKNRLWVGKDVVARIVPSPDGLSMAMDQGADCGVRSAVLSNLDGTKGDALLPSGSNVPTSVIGWLDASHVLVAEGGCSGPSSLWVVETGASTRFTLLADGIDRAAVRVPDRLPTPALPDIGVNEGLA